MPGRGLLLLATPLALGAPTPGPRPPPALDPWSTALAAENDDDDDEAQLPLVVPPGDARRQRWLVSVRRPGLRALLAVQVENRHEGDGARAGVEKRRRRRGLDGAGRGRDAVDGGGGGLEHDF